MREGKKHLGGVSTEATTTKPIIEIKGQGGSSPLEFVSGYGAVIPGTVGTVVSLRLPVDKLEELLEDCKKSCSPAIYIEVRKTQGKGAI